MYPDELLRMDNAKEIVLFRGQSPLMLYKITPEELPAYPELRPVRATDYIPVWRGAEIKQDKCAEAIPNKPVSVPISFSTQLFDQTNLFEGGKEQPATARCKTLDTAAEQTTEHGREKRPDESSERQEQPRSSHLKYTHITPYEVLDNVRQQEGEREPLSHESKRG